MASRFFLYFFLIFLAVACQNQQPQKIREIFEEIRLKHAPDKRVALFRLDTILDTNPLIIKGKTTLPVAKTEFFDALMAAGMAFTDSLQLLPSAVLEGKHFGLVNVSVCNIRSKPGNSQELGTQALLGTPLRVWDKENGYYLIQTPDDYFGWLDGGGFELLDSTVYEVWGQSERVVVLEDYVFAYEQPDEKSPKVSDLLAGCILQSIENQGFFTKIQFPDGRSGFVLSQKLMPFQQWLDSRQPDAEHLLAAARELMGRPYLWGGTSGKGMDCSGFTKTVFYLNGIQLPRDANQQATVGLDVAMDTTFQSAQPGDLLFFGRKATADKTEKISHVAIYLGDGNIIHASDRVEVNSLRRGAPDFSEERLRSFVRCKRVIGSKGKNGVLRVRDVPLYMVSAQLAD
jgi:hypothetical protein